MANYKWIKNGVALQRIADSACIPADPANRDYQAFLASGAVADPEDAPSLETQNAPVKAELAAIDLASVRSLREYVASLPGAPQAIKDRETAAQAARAKLK